MRRPPAADGPWAAGSAAARGSEGGRADPALAPRSLLSPGPRARAQAHDAFEEHLLAAAPAAPAPDGGCTLEAFLTSAAFPTTARAAEALAGASDDDAAAFDGEFDLFDSDDETAAFRPPSPTP